MGAPAGHSLLFAVGAGPPHDVEVKLLLLSGRMGAPAGHSLLFAVGAGPPHDGVRKARRLNLSHDLAGVPPAGSGLSTRSPRPSSPQERSGVPSWGWC